uniref:Aquaporin n=1 Tax=Leersia perrieri TaxID=77586 RepID=A0A0D9WDS1_9ORYZ
MAGGEHGVNGQSEETRAMEEGSIGGGDQARCENSEQDGRSKSSSKNSMFSVQFVQKLIAEVFGTFFLIFAGCAAVAVNKTTGGTVTFPWRQLPAYAAAQLAGSAAASLVLRALFGGEGEPEHFFGTVPAGSEVQSLVMEFIITFYLMFVVSGVATDNRAIGELAGLAVGATVLLNVLFAGPISGASMNPARTVGPAIVLGRYTSIWVYIAGPVSGAVAGAWAYNLIRFTDKPLREITQTASFIRSTRRS